MSAFTESYHLQADSQEAGVELLRAGEARGFVLQPRRGWVTIVPEPGETIGPIARFANGVLLHLLTTPGQGWMFELFVDGIPTSSYLCRWDEQLLVIDDHRLVLEPVIELAAGRGHDLASARRELEAILHPREDDLVDEGEGEDPAISFARLLGLTYSRPGESERLTPDRTLLLEAPGVARVA